MSEHNDLIRRYCVYEKATGAIRWHIDTTAGVAAQQETDQLGIVEGEFDPATQRIDHAAQQAVPRPPDPPPVQHYATLRSREYPDVRDQLDALWRAMDAGLLPKVPEFYDPIATVKTKYPKG